MRSASTAVCCTASLRSSPRPARPASGARTEWNTYARAEQVNSLLDTARTALGDSTKEMERHLAEVSDVPQ